ncbi:sigma-54 dependent transcriptional regulator [Pendulispora brunnea]|uniref:Sigma-54 dependent transcriptional regulator n=1 Tax=Pendulispora brunnea TaxID=2905690 RepID=A0ABZ2K310_9BACT
MTERTHGGENDTSREPHILLVDDDIELCELVSLRLEAKGHRVSVEHTVKGALRRIGSEYVDTVLLDLRLGQEDGFEVLDGIAKRSPDVPVIVLTAHGTIDTAVESIRKGAFGFVTKPFLDHDLLEKIGHAIESSRLRREIAGLRRVMGDGHEDARLVGVSPAIERIREIITRVAPTDASVLILGESGTGKELVARSFHALSRRAHEPFIAVNCAGLAPELLESTLFGHTKGAFTGATANREGLFGAANKGTLFLDEIAEAPPAVQAKLLRVLQEKRYTPVGTTTEQEANVRILAATNRDLRQEVLERRFREDLFYRLHVVPVTMPPLRERKEDILLLAEMFLERAAARYRFSVPRIGDAARAALFEHPWPGNVRELANVMEAAVLAGHGGELKVEHLPGVTMGESPAQSMLEDFSTRARQLLDPYVTASAQTFPALRDARDAFERAYLDVVLSRTSGNVSSAARLAGRNRTDFYDLLRRHGYSPAVYKRSD